MIYTIGTPMVLSLYAENNCKKATESVELCDGSLFVLDPMDDERYRHGCEFACLTAQETGCGVSFVFRWLSKTSQFYGGDASNPFLRFA